MSDTNQNTEVGQQPIVMHFEVSRYVTVKFDESKFTPDFMKAFKKHFYQFDTIEQHIKFLARLAACGSIDQTTEHLDGYGKLSDFGISVVADGIDEDDVVHA